MTDDPRKRLPLEELLPPELLQHWREIGGDGNGRYILNEQGDAERCPDLVQWALWMESSTKDGSRVIAHDRDEREGASDVFVSTVFLGLDYGSTFVRGGPPVLWETMIFGGVHDGYQRRYTSREAALEGHRVACALVSQDHQ